MQTVEIEEIRSLVKDILLKIDGKPGNGGGLRGQLNEIKAECAKIEKDMLLMCNSLDARVSQIAKIQSDRISQDEKRWDAIDRTKDADKRVFLSGFVGSGFSLLALLLLGGIVFWIEQPSHQFTANPIVSLGQPEEPIAMSVPRNYLYVREFVEDYNRRTGRAINEDTARRWIREGRIPANKIRGRWAIPLDYTEQIMMSEDPD